jgi:hypothetical protein
MSIHNPIPKFVTYLVEPVSQLTAKVTIGDAQSGGWAIGFDDTHVKKGSGEDPVPVGSGRDVKGKLLQIVVTVVDVRPETNHLSCTVTIAGGPSGPVEVEQAYDEGGDGDTAIFTTLVQFQ